MNTCELYAEDQGYGEFGIVMNMILVLQEAYSNGGCYFVKSGKLCKVEGYLLVLQGVLGKRITLPGRTRMWDTYLFFRNSGEYSNITRDDLFDSYSESCGNWDIEKLFAVLEVESQTLMVPDKKRISCREEIGSASPLSRTEYAYRIFCGLNEDEKSMMERFLAKLLNLNFAERKEQMALQDERGIIAELSLYVLSARLVLAYAQAVAKDFWELWDSFGSKGYSDIIQKDNPDDTDSDLRKMPFYNAILRNNEDEFLEYWNGSNLILSQDMEKNIRSWKQQFASASVPSAMLPEYLLKNVIVRMRGDSFRYVAQAFVTEFLEQADDLNHQKALILLEQLLNKGQEYFPELTGEQAEEWIIQGKRDESECVAISALMSFLTNQKQRNEIFGF